MTVVTTVSFFLWVETRPSVLRHGPALPDLLVTLDKPYWQRGTPFVREESGPTSGLKGLRYIPKLWSEPYYRG